MSDIITCNERYVTQFAEHKITEYIILSAIKNENKWPSPCNDTFGGALSSRYGWTDEI